MELSLQKQTLLTSRSLKLLIDMGIPSVPLSTTWERLNEYVDSVFDQYMALLCEAAPHDFSCYCEYMSPDEPPESALHKMFCDTLSKVESREIMRIAVSVPPGSGKSHYWSRMFPTWYLGRNFKHKFLSSSHSASFASNELGKKCRAIINQDEYGDVFPGTELSVDSKAAESWTTNKGAGYQTKGVGQAISGYRAHIGAVDDAIGGRKDSLSVKLNDDVFSWFMDDFMTRLLPNSPVMVIMTRWSLMDLISRIEDLNKEGKGLPYTILNLPAICEKDNILGLPEGSSIWPEFYSKQFYLEKKATLSVRGWASLYMGKPISADSGVMQEDWLFRYDAKPSTDQTQQITLKKTVISVDTANTANERSDYTVLQVWQQGSDGRHYLVDNIKRRVEFEGLVKLLDQVSLFWQANVILVEDRGSGTQLLQVRGATSSNPSPVPLIPISTKNLSKEFRFDAITPMFSSGLVLLPENASWLKDYITELLSFPNGKFKDSVDASSQYLEWARQTVKLGSVKLRTR